MQQPAVSVVLGSYNRLKFLKPTIETVREELSSLALPSEIIVVDGGSTDGTIKWLTAQKDIIAIIQHNRGTWSNKPIKKRSWGYFMNLGFKCAQGKYVCMISDDCLIVPNAIKNGYYLAEEKSEAGEKIGAVAFYWRNLPFFYSDWKKEKTYVVLYVFDIPLVNHGLYLKRALEEVNYIDENSYLFYAADGDLCLRLAQKGYLCIESPNSYIEHYHHANPSLRQGNANNADYEVFYKKWISNLNWPKHRECSSQKTKEYKDPNRTMEKFKIAHVTNFGFWITFIKTVARNKATKLFERQKPC